MSITRINEFEAKPGKGRRLRELIESFVPKIRSSAGCVSCQLMKDVDEPDRIVAIEVWDSPDAHKEAMRAIPPKAMKEAMTLLAAPPRGAYYEE